VQQLRRWFRGRVNAVTARGVERVVTVVVAPLENRYYQTPVGISDDLHVAAPLGTIVMPVTSNLEGASEPLR
jgi:hypothetical protein